MKKMIESLLKLLASIFGGKKKPQGELPPDSSQETSPEPEAPPEPEDEPEDEFDDPAYDVETVTPDDHTERDDLEDEPDQELLDEVEAQMVPLDSWKERQQALTDLGYSLGKVDGIPGRKTSAAVGAFEKDHGLPVDGNWDRNLQRAVGKALKEKSKKPLKPMPFAPPPMLGYEDMIDESECELDDAFYACFIDLTAKSNIQTKSGRRRKGTRQFKRLTRFCWHQTAFVWRPYRVSKALKKYTTHHKMNAHVMVDSDGTILLLHNFKYYLWTANTFNPDCLSIEVLGNFEGIQGSGKWYKGDKFGRARPSREQIIRCRQLKKWLLDPEQGPADADLPKPLLEWRQGVRKYGNPLKWTNTHREATDDRNADCGSELWYHVGEWSFAKTKLTHGLKKGRGKMLPPEWSVKPPAPPVPPAGSVDA